MDLIETVGARLVLMGRAEYVAGLSEAKKSLADMGASAKTTAVASDQMTAATIKQEAAAKTLAAAMAQAVTAQQEFDAALAASAEATAAAAAGADEEAAAMKRVTDANLAAAAAARDSALAQVKASQESAAAATDSAAAVEVADGKKAASADLAGGAMKTAAFGIVAISAVVVGASVKMAADFQSSTERLVTSAGEQQSSLNLVRDGILAMAGQVGYSAEALSAAMYKVESGGQHGAAGLVVLKAAAEGAKTENADLTTVSDALTSALTDYHLPASAAADVTSKLVAATSAGKMTFEELAGSMSAILPIASANHISLNDILGDLASMTTHGIPAQQATQNLADAVRHMAGAFQTQGKEFAALGLNAQQLSADLGTKGLSGTITEISNAITSRMGPGATKVVLDLNTALKGLPASVQALGAKVLDGSMSMKDFTAQAKNLNVVSSQQVKSFATLVGGFHQIGMTQQSGGQVMQSYTQAMQKAMGTSTGMNVALMLTGENAGTTSKAIDAVSKATAQADGHVRGWDEIQGTFNTKLSQAKDGIGALAIQIGTVLLPPLTTLLGWVVNGVNWFAQHKDAAVALAVVMGGVLVIGLGAATIAAWGFLAPLLAIEVTIFGIEAPIIAVVAVVVAAIALIAFAVYEVISHWSAISGFFAGLWNTVVGYFTDQWHKIEAVGSAVASAFTSAWKGVSGFFVDAFHVIADAATWLWNTILSPVFNAIGLVARILVAIIVTLVVAPIVIAIKLLASFAIFLWENAFKPAFELIGAGAMWLWNNAIKPAWDGVKNAISVVWTWLQANVFAPIGVAIAAIGAANTFLVNNFIVPAWQAIKTAIDVVWQWLNANVFTPIKAGVLLLGQAFTNFWNGVIVPAWNGIQNAINVVWQWINNNIFTPIKTGVQIVGQAFTNLWNNYIVPAWQGIQNAATTAWAWIDKYVFTPFKAGIALLGTAFQSAKDLIGTIWKGVEDAVAAPIHWVVDVVYTQGIKAVWDKVASFVNLPGLPDAPKFAGGGVLGGYSPGVDSIPAMLSPGEAVLVPELVQAIGPQAIMDMNAQFSGGRPGTILGAFSGGGLVHAAGGAAPPPVAGGSGGNGNGGGNIFTSAAGAVGGFLNGAAGAVGSAVGAVGSAIGNIVGSIADFLSDPIGNATSWLGKVFTDLAPGANSPVAKVAFGVPEKAVSGLVDKVKSWFTSQQAAAAAAGPGGAVGAAPAAAGGNVGLVQSMAAARGWTGAQWNALYAVMMRESGFNNNAQNPTSTAYGMFQFLDSTWAAYGATKTSDPAAQTTAGLNYIASRYGSPAGALAHEQQFGWYSGGGVALPARANGGPVDGGYPYLVGERGPELFVPGSDGAILPSGPTSGLGLGSTHVDVHPGAVVIHQAVDPKATYEAVKQGIADAVARR